MIDGLDWGEKTVCVRINELTTEYAYGDIIEVIEGAHARLDVIMLIKCMGPDDITFCDKLISMMEKKLKLKKTIGLETLIEKVEALQRVVDRALRRREAFDAAIARGEGAARFEGRMIDVASRRILDRIVDRANLIGMCRLPGSGDAPRAPTLRGARQPAPCGNILHARPSIRSPHFDPMVNAFAKLRARLRKDAPRTVEGRWPTIRPGCRRRGTARRPPPAHPAGRCGRGPGSPARPARRDRPPSSRRASASRRTASTEADGLARIPANQ